jgi:hypothetical protein
VDGKTGWLEDFYLQYGERLLRGRWSVRRIQQHTGLDRARAEALNNYTRQRANPRAWGKSIPDYPPPPGWSPGHFPPVGWRAADAMPGPTDDLVEPEDAEAVKIQRLEDDLRTHKRLLREQRREDALRQRILETAFQLGGTDLGPPKWILDTREHKGTAGIPTLLLSDLHWGEVVAPSEVFGRNEYNMSIAAQRLERVINTSADLLRSVVVSPGGYPGIVVCLGGDMISGGIHEELLATDEAPPAACVVDLASNLATALTVLADEFGRVLVPCVTGNHGRATRKTWKKKRVETSWDWMLYLMVQQHFKSDDRVRFIVSHDTDVLYTVAGHRYLLTHGDSMGVQGGNGIVGSLGPIMRGRHKIASANADLGRHYDTLVMGHWHQYISLRHVVVNGCFPAGTPVTTPTGPQDIATVAPGDTVLSRDGTWQTVNHVFEKSSEQGLVGLKVRGIPECLWTTPNHLVWGIKGETRASGASPRWRKLIGEGDQPQWIPADFVSPGDWVHVPYPSGDERPFTVDEAWAYGIYLAEGCTILDGGARKNSSRINFTMHRDELEVLQRVAEILGPRWPRAPRVALRKGRNTSTLNVSPGRDVCVRMREDFGHRAKGKRLPASWHRLAPDLKAAVVQGWIDGDGHTRDDGVISATTISPQLAWGMFYLALSSGQRPSLATLAPGGRRKSTAYTIHFNKGQESREVDGELFYRVHHRFRNRNVVPVFDLEVSGEHTYTAGGVGVHNSLKGYDEYARGQRFAFEPPTQALWLTHPTHGVTISMPVFADDVPEPAEDVWEMLA